MHAPQMGEEEEQRRVVEEGQRLRVRAAAVDSGEEDAFPGRMFPGTLQVLRHSVPEYL